MTALPRTLFLAVGLFLILFAVAPAYAQTTFGPQQIITFDRGSMNSVFAADLDGDGDQDMLSASDAQDERGYIVWYENTDGLGTFGPQQIIITFADFARSVFAADLDGDGDQDVLSASEIDDKIAWYENTDGVGAFGPQQFIARSAVDSPRSVFAADLDGDGDQDVLSTSFLGDKIAWHQNTDGLGHFGPQQIITTLADGARSVFAADLDGDGDLDVLATSDYDDKIAWYENVGPIITVTCTPVSPPIVIPAGGGVYAYDIEIVNNSPLAETFDVWFNIRTSGTDVTRRAITRTLAPGASLSSTLNQNVPGVARAADYTHTCIVGAFAFDSNFDSAFDSDSFEWEKSETLPPHGVSVADWSTEAELAAALSSAPATVSLTGDVPSNYAPEGSYPNPFNPHTTIRFGLPESAQIRLVVYDVLGRQISVLLDGTREAGTHEVVFDADGLPSGTYLYRLETPQGSFVQTMLLAK